MANNILSPLLIANSSIFYAWSKKIINYYTYITTDF